MYGMQCLGQYPAHDLMGICIRHKMQIADSFVGLDVCDVCHKELTRGIWDKALYQVLPLVEMMVGIGRMPLAYWLQHQMVLVQQLIETVTSHHPVRIQGLQHEEQLVAAYHGSFLADFLDGVHYERCIELLLPELIRIMLVVSIPASSKQLGKSIHACARVPAAQVQRCLEPTFFNMSTPSDSL